MAQSPEAHENAGARAGSGAHEGERARSSALNRAFVDGLRLRFALADYPLRHASAGQSLVNFGEPLTRLPLVESGVIDAVLHVGDQGHQVIPVTFGPGELALTSVLFSAPTANAALFAHEDLAARWLPIADLERCLLDHHELLVLLVRFLSQRLREVQSRERGWLERGLQERVCAVLVRVAREFPRGPDGHVTIQATHEHLAARCGVSRPKLSHALKRMERSGALKLHRGAIEILDPGRLEEVNGLSR